VDNSTITISKVCRSTIDNSTIDNSTICYSTIGWSDVDNSTIDNSTIDNSTIDNSTLTDSDFDNSTTGGGSNFDNVTGDNLTCTNCDLDDLICNDCVLDNVTVCNATLDNVTFTNVTACQDDGSGGYVPMDFDNETRENQTTTETVKPDLSSWTVLNSSSAWVSADLGTSSKTIRELTNIRVTFSEAMDTTTVTANSDNTSCSGSIQVTLSTQNFSTCIQMTANDPTTSDNVTFEVNPASALANINAKYYIKVLAGVKDMSGNSKSDDNVTSNGFVTCKYDVSAGCE